MTLHVAFVIPEFPHPSDLDRGERLAFDLAWAITHGPHGVEGDVLVPARAPEPTWTGDDRLRVRELNAAWGAERGEAASWALAEHVANADVVHIHDLTTRWGECALLAAAAWKRPICVTEHGFGTSRLGPAVNARKLATVGAGPSRYGASLIGATKRDSLVFGGGVDDEFFHPPASTNDRPAVLIASPIDSARDAQALEELLPDAAEVFVGGRVSEDVVLHQRMQRVRSPQEFREAAGRCFAVIGPRPGNPESTRPEPALPLTMLAAMACGVPPVASPVGAVSEIVTNAVSGFLVEHDGDIASVVRLLSREPDLVMSVGQAARETCADWNLSGATERLVTLYREIAAA